MRQVPLEIKKDKQRIKRAFVGVKDSGNHDIKKGGTFPD